MTPSSNGARRVHEEGTGGVAPRAPSRACLPLHVGAGAFFAHRRAEAVGQEREHLRAAQETVSGRGAQELVKGY